MKICKGWLQALLSSGPRGFAARSRVLARPVSLAQTGELASRLQILKCTRYVKVYCYRGERMLLKRGTGSGERGAGSGERGTEVWVFWKVTFNDVK